MALVVFSQQAGQVVTFADPAFPGQLSLKLTGWNGARRMKAIITRGTLSSACNFQLMHVLGGDAYLYVFGDRVGQSTLSGLAFETFCGEDKAAIGIESVVKYYRENRLSVRESPLKITIGGALSIKGYLAAMQADVEDAATRIWRFSLNFLEPPEPLPKNDKVDEDADAGGGDDGGDDGGAAGGGSPGGGGSDELYDIILQTDPQYAAGSRTDAGGYDPDATDPLPAGKGYATYGSGPPLPYAAGFQVTN